MYSKHLQVYSPNYSIKNTRDIQVLWLVHFINGVLFTNLMWNKILVILYKWWNDDYDNNISSHKSECKEVENYDKVMESHTNYLTILYNLALVYKQRLKKIYLTKVKGYS